MRVRSDGNIWEYNGSSSGTTFTGNTSGTCITDLYITNLHGCSPITVHDSIQHITSIASTDGTLLTVLGTNNKITNNDYPTPRNSSILGGRDNILDGGLSSIICGGAGNVITGNTIGYLGNFIGAGFNNRIETVYGYSSIVGGINNTIQNFSFSCFIGGGDNNMIYANSPSSILGGKNNTIDNNQFSSIDGGYQNTIKAGSHCAIIGGDNNMISGTSAINNTVIIGGSGITGSTSNTVYVPNFNISTLGTGTSINNLGVDSSGNVVTGTTGGVSEVTTATTTTIDFTGQTIYYNSSSPGTGNISENLSGAKLGTIQKIYHNDASEPTYPAGWVLLGDAIYMTSILNIIYMEWAGGSRVEYWYVQEQ